jgi:hypothetical protein
MRGINTLNPENDSWAELLLQNRSQAAPIASTIHTSPGCIVIEKSELAHRDITFLR